MMESTPAMPTGAATTTAVRRSNNRKITSSEENGQGNGTVLPLHHNNGINDPSTKGYKKRRRKRRNKPLYCCGMKVDVPVVGVATILLSGALLLVMLGSNSFRRVSTADGGDAPPGTPFHHHFDHQDIVHHKQLSHRRKNRRQLDAFEQEEEDGFRKPKLQRAGREEPESGAAVVIPESHIREIIYERHPSHEIYDVVVAGAGPSGLTAALFAARAGLRVHVLGSPATGLLSQTKLLDNFPSFVGAGDGAGAVARSGPEWVETTRAQAASWGATFGPPGLLAASMERQRIVTKPGNTHDGEEEKKDVFFAITTADRTEVRAWSVIAASGATPRTLGLPGEDALWGVSLHNCAICDGHLYTGTPEAPKTVLVVGGGDAALDGALLLARYATRVVLVHRRDEFLSAHNPAGLARVRATPNIELRTPNVVTEWITKDDDPTQLVGARLVSSERSLAGDTDGARTTVDIDGAFVMIGAAPNTEWTKTVGIALDEEGLIRTTRDLPRRTDPRDSSGGMVTASSVPGLFAAGEVTDNIYKQAITAASAGAQAAIDAERWLREHRGVTGTADVTTGGDDGTTTDTAAAARTTGDSDPVGCDLVSEDCIKSIVGKHPVVVFSKQWCPYCKKALEALSRAGLPEGSETLLVIDLTKRSNTIEIQSTLQQMTGRRTVPNVFVGGISIGGGDETHSLQQDGKLVHMLKKAKALGDHPTDSVSGSNVQEDIKTESRRKAAEEEEEETARPPAKRSSTEREICDLASEDCFRTIVAKYPILLFSLSWCPECKRSLELLDRIGITVDMIHVIDLDDYPDIALTIRAHMKAMTGRPSVPNLFVGGDFVGGFRRTSEMHEAGELVPKFEGIGALPRSS